MNTNEDRSDALGKGLSVLGSAALSVGGPLASYFGSRLGVARERRAETALRSLRRRVSRIEDKMRTDALETDHLAELVLRMIRLAESTLVLQRVEAAAEVITRFLLKDDEVGHVSFDQAEFLMNVVQSLPNDAFRVLAAANQQALSELSKLRKGDSVRVRFRQLRRDLGGLDPDLLMGLVGELDRFNLLRRGGPPDVKMGEKYDSYDLSLTPLGFQLVELLDSIDPVTGA